MKGPKEKLLKFLLQMTKLIKSYWTFCETTKGQKTRMSIQTLKIDLFVKETKCKGNWNYFPTIKISIRFP